MRIRPNVRQANVYAAQVPGMGHGACSPQVSSSGRAPSGYPKKREQGQIPMSRQPLLPREAYRYWQRIETLWADNDVYGHVNNTVHYRWFDTVVNTWLIDAGLLDPVNGNPIGLVVETGCRFTGSITFPEPVGIGLLVEKLGNSSVTYRLGIFRSGVDEAAAEGHFTHVYVDRESRRPVPIPPDWRGKLMTLQRNQN